MSDIIFSVHEGCNMRKQARNASRNRAVPYCLRSVLCIVMLVVMGCITPKKDDFGDFCSRAVAEQREMMEQYVERKQFGKKLPHLEGAALARYLSKDFTDSEKESLKRMVAAEFDQCRDKTVFPAWIKYKNSEIQRKTAPLIESAKAAAADKDFDKSRAEFEACREIIWQESVNAILDGQLLDVVNRAVWATSIELLDTNVNLQQWPIIEREMRMIQADAVASGSVDEGIAKLKKLPLIRTYTKLLDGKVDAMMKELVRLGVSVPATRQVAMAMHKFMCEAANLADTVDKTESRVIPGEKWVAIDDSIYQRLLEEFRRALIIHDCTQANADDAAAWLKKQAEDLIAKIKRPELAPERTETSIVRLGASAINARIGALRVKLLKTLNEEKLVCQKMLESLQSQVANGDTESAVDKIHSILNDSNSSAILKYQAREYLKTTVNPLVWDRIEAELRRKTEEFAKTGKCVEGVAWIAAYPEIKTYAPQLDERFAEIERKAVSLGVTEDAARSVMQQIAAKAAEAANLADYEDSEKIATGPKVEIDRAGFEFTLKNAHKTLVDNGCTLKNADALVADIRNQFSAAFAAKEAGPRTLVRRIGSNAVNVRLRKLKIECADLLIVKCVVECVDKGNFDKARLMLRDVAITGMEEFDAKIFATRLGVLDTFVNPRQCEVLSLEIEKTIKAMWKTGDFRNLKKWIGDYPYVHDVYPDLVKSYETLGNAMMGLGLKDKVSKEYLSELEVRIRTLIEKASRGYDVKPNPEDVKALAIALEEFRKAFLAQYYDKMVVDTVQGKVKDEIMAMLEKWKVKSISTWELNDLLRKKIREVVLGLAEAEGDMEIVLNRLVARQEYLELVTAMDSVFSYDSQIAMAEDAISRQLGDTDPEAHLSANAVLGDYARAMRLLKLRKPLSSELLSSVMFGAVYLDQASVLDMAKDLKADVNSVCQRDPLKRSPLLLAIQLGHTRLIQRLVSSGAKASIVDANGDTVVHYAARLGNISVLKAMMKAVDVNRLNGKNETALFDAARKGQTSIVNELIAAKVKVSVANSAGLSAFDEACRCGSVEVLDSLEKAGSKYGVDQLRIAADNDRITVAQWLVTRGVDVNGEGVMDAAVSNALRRGLPHTATLRYLVQEGGLASLPVVLKPSSAVVEPAKTNKTAEVSGSIKFRLGDPDATLEIAK